MSRMSIKKQLGCYLFCVCQKLFWFGNMDKCVRIVVFFVILSFVTSARSYPDFYDYSSYGSDNEGYHYPQPEQPFNDGDLDSYSNRGHKHDYEYGSNREHKHHDYDFGSNRGHKHHDYDFGSNRGHKHHDYDFGRHFGSNEHNPNQYEYWHGQGSSKWNEDRWVLPGSDRVRPLPPIPNRPGPTRVPLPLPPINPPIKPLPPINPLPPIRPSPNRFPATSTPAPSALSTLTCIRRCPVTSEYNPVCGSNNITYTNPGRLECAQNCGVDVRLRSRSACPAPTPPPDTTISTSGQTTPTRFTTIEYQGSTAGPPVVVPPVTQPTDPGFTIPSDVLSSIFTNPASQTTPPADEDIDIRYDDSR